jgi:DmsE family decaheme c-type cytochrome
MNVGVSAQEQDHNSVTKRRPSFTDGGAESCLRCHSGEEMRAVAASPHWNKENPQSPISTHECESCHGRGSIHASRAHGGRGFPPLMRFGRGAAYSPREEQLQTCLNCHEKEGTGNQMIAFLGSPHDRSNINCSTCHKLHVEVDPIKDIDQQKRTCFRCHRKQRDEHPQVDGKSPDFDALSCWTCHDVHSAVSNK